MDETPRPVYRYHELLDLELPPLQPIIEGLLDEESGMILAGPPNVGKTWIEFGMARAIAAGKSFVCHFPTTKRRVLVIDEESNLPGIQARIRMLEDGDPSDGDLEIVFAVSMGVRLDTPAGFAAITQLHEEFRPAVTFIDSLTRVHGADENNAGQMADVFRNAKTIMRTYKTSFVFLDHLRKRGMLNDPEEMLRGTTEKRAWPDSILFVSPQGKNRVTISHIKSRYSEKVQDFQIDINVDKDAGTAELVHAGIAPLDTKSKANDIIEAIHELKKQWGPDFADATKIAAWLECSPDTVERHCRKLVATGILILRTVPSGDRGGRPKKVYDVQGGRD